jgi:hypothetical protein
MKITTKLTYALVTTSATHLHSLQLEISYVQVLTLLLPRPHIETAVLQLFATVLHSFHDNSALRLHLQALQLEALLVQLHTLLKFPTNMCRTRDNRSEAPSSSSHLHSLQLEVLLVQLRHLWRLVDLDGALGQARKVLVFKPASPPAAAAAEIDSVMIGLRSPMQLNSAYMILVTETASCPPARTSRRSYNREATRIRCNVLE